MKPSSIAILIAALAAAFYFVTRPIPKSTTPLDVLKKVGGLAADAATKIGSVGIDATGAAMKLPGIKQALGIADNTVKVVSKAPSVIENAPGMVAKILNPFSYF